MAGKIIEVPISNLSVDFFVRRGLNDEHVLGLAMLIEGGQELPPILINNQRQVIDGRHRIKASELAGKTTIKAEIRSEGNRGQELMLALTSNLGGSLPPSPADIRLAIMNMFAAGMTSANIKKGLPFPPAVSRRYVDDAQSHMRKSKLTAAIEAVTENDMRIQDAAEKFGIDAEDLRAAIRGKKKNVTDSAFGIAKVKT